MSVRIRLTRVGSKKNPIWRVVVADQRSPRDGRFIETIGQYNAQTNPSTIVLDKPRLDHWLERGAQPTNTVKSLIKAHSKDAPPAEEQAVATAEAPAEPEEPAAQADAPPAAEEPAPDEAPAADEAAPAEESAG
jgi:small subunit ribosomal protein S16